jgi:NAD(P)-dependent dehydrogenase (short-subunit alcohol dehydrogenase family)
VVALDRAPDIEATVAAIRASGGRGAALVGDSSVEDVVAGAVALAVKEFGGLDVCYANAGISGGMVPFFEETAERWAQVLQVNLIGTGTNPAADGFTMGIVMRFDATNGADQALRSGPGACRTAPARPVSSAWCKRRPISSMVRAYASMPSAPA